MNEWVSDGGDCRTAPATPSLLNMLLRLNCVTLKWTFEVGTVQLLKVSLGWMGFWPQNFWQMTFDKRHMTSFLPNLSWLK